MLTFDLSAFERAAQRLSAAADQIPFALATALNDAAEATRNYLISDTWPRHVMARDANFIGAALTTKGQRATKRNLQVTIYDKLDRAHLNLHAKGGTKPSRGRVAIPESHNVKARRSARGIPKGLRPRGIANSFVADLRGRGPAVWQRLSVRQAKKQKRQIKLMYILKPSVSIRKDVPFYEDFSVVMRRELIAKLPGAIAKAMAGRR